MSTNVTGSQKPTDDLPGAWYRTESSEVARYRHPSGALIRIRRELPMRDAATFNDGASIDGAEGELTVLFHADALPSEADELHRGGTEQDGRDAALAAMRERPGQ